MYVEKANIPLVNDPWMPVKAVDRAGSTVWGFAENRAPEHHNPPKTCM
jgi:hypothetical protein